MKETAVKVLNIAANTTPVILNDALTQSEEEELDNLEKELENEFARESFLDDRISN